MGRAEEAGPAGPRWLHARPGLFLKRLEIELNPLRLLRRLLQVLLLRLRLLHRLLHPAALPH